MALQREIYKQGLIDLFTEMRTIESNPQGAAEMYAERFAQLTEQFIKSGEVIVEVTTVGSATTQTGIGTGTIS